jgi:hypothetical protein
MVISGGGSYTIWNASSTHTGHDFLPGKSLPVLTPEMPTGAVDAKRSFSS